MDIITETLAGPFQYAFMLRALIVSVLVGIMCPVLGVFVVTRGLGFMGDAISHSMLPGMVAAYLLGASPFSGAIPMAIVVALGSGYLIKRAGIGEDTSVGIVFAGLFALGLVMLTASRGIPVSLEDILLGQVLGASWSDVFVTAGLAIAVLAIIFGLGKELVYASFDPTGCSVIGLPTEKLEYLLLGMLAVVVVLTLYAVGIVLVISMLITPAATALLLVRNFGGAAVVGAVIGIASVIAGLYISYYYNMPPSPIMALVASFIFLMALGWKQGVAGFIQHRRARHV